MDGREFYRRVQEHAHLTWRGVRQGVNSTDDVVLISHDGHGSWQPGHYAVSISAIGGHSWDDLQAVLTGKRQPRIMVHMSRIVGYYSMVHNWNGSKKAELHDRQKGNYGVPEMTKGDGSVKEVERQEAAKQTAPAGV
jgi:hypothetical protein